MSDVKVYIEPRDWWVGYYQGDTHHYVCPLPTLVVRWPRRKQSGGDDRAMTSRDEYEALMESGRRLASQRDDLIAAGVDPADLAVPLAPLAPLDAESAPGDVCGAPCPPSLTQRLVDDNCTLPAGHAEWIANPATGHWYNHRNVESDHWWHDAGDGSPSPAETPGRAP